MAPRSLPPITRAVDHDGSSMRVLFVDDEPDVLDGLEAMLRARRLRWSSSFALGGEEAVRALEREHFDAVVTDMRMPGMSGTELLERVRELSPDTVRIVLSGYTEPASALRAVPVAHEFLAKPCSSDGLRDAVERAVQLRRALEGDAIRAIVAGATALPAAPHVFARLTEALAADRSSIAEVAQLVEGDVAVAARILQVVNSSFYGRSRRIVDMREAVGLIGLGLLRGLVLSVEVFSTLRPEAGRRLDVEQLERHAAQVSAVASAIAPDELRSQALVAGLLHDVGRLLLVHTRPDDADRCHELHAASGRPLHEVERELLGTTHAEIGASLLALWGLPFPVVAAVAHHHAPERTGAAGIDLVAVVAIADAVAHGRELDEELLGRDGIDEVLARLQ